MRTYDREQVIELLRKRKGSKPIPQLAAEIGVASAYLAQILGGFRNPGNRVLRFLGLGKEKVTTVTYFELNGAKK